MTLRAHPDRRLAGLLAAVALTATLAAVAVPGGGPGPAPAAAVIVRGAGAAAAVAAHGGAVRAVLPLVGGVAADVPTDAVDLLAAAAGVSAVDPDTAVATTSVEFSAAAHTTTAATVQADAVDADGTGVGVAVVDTGVDLDHPDLIGRVAAVANLSREATYDDTYGHGTFMAGLVAGTGASGFRTGIAPGAHLMAVKVAGADGTTSLSQVIYGLQLVAASAATHDIGVVLLALSAPPTPDHTDPLEAAVQQLWADGLVVVVAAGNTAEQPGSPATSPYVVAVGTTDDAATTDRDDDRVTDFSASGPGDGGVLRPDVAAPGRSVVSLRAAGSTVDAANPHAREAGHYFRGTGTSMSAAVTAGAAALIRQQHPTWTPDQVKGALTRGAYELEADPGADRGGWGQVDVAQASQTDAVANGDLPPLTARPAPLPGTHGRWATLDDGMQVWTGRSWAGHSWTGHSWTGHSWTGHSWTGRSWAGHSWAGEEWMGHSWTGHSWTGVTWDGHSWAGRSWADLGWEGRSWASEEWSSALWNGRSWAAYGW